MKEKIEKFLPKVKIFGFKIKVLKEKLSMLGKPLLSRAHTQHAGD